MTDKVTMALQPPGPILPAGDEDSAKRVPYSTIEVHRERSDEAYYITGRQGPCAIVRFDGQTVAILTPDILFNILRFWASGRIGI
jgi:hypothetical protein